MLGRSVWHSPSANDSARIPWIMASPIRFQNLWVPTSKIFQDPRNSSISWRSASLWGLIEAQFKKPPLDDHIDFPGFWRHTHHLFGELPSKQGWNTVQNVGKMLGNILYAWRENGSKCYPKDVESWRSAESLRRTRRSSRSGACTRPEKNFKDEVLGLCVRCRQQETIGEWAIPNVPIIWIMDYIWSYYIYIILYNSIPMNYYWVVQSNYNPKLLDEWFLGIDDDTCSHLVVESPELIIGMFQPFPACRAQGSQLHPTRIHGPGRSSKPGFSHVFCPKILGVVIMFPNEHWPWATGLPQKKIGQPQKESAMSRWKPPDRLFYWSRILPLAAPAYDHLVKCREKSVGTEM